MLSRALDQLLSSSGGLPDPLPSDPMPLFVSWFEGAARARREPNPNAITLATCTPDARPAARIVLCKGIDAASASILFFTNYRSRKAGELDSNPRAAAVFHWDHADRQVRLEGRIERATAAESDAYFHSRPLMARLGAWASEQSRPLPARADLLSRLAEVIERFALSPADLLDPAASASIPRPEHWGGYRLRIDAIELWQGHPARLHDRARWERAAGGWTSTRLFP